MKIVVTGQALITKPVVWPDRLRSLTRDADAVICNFEGCLPPPGAWPMKAGTVHAAHPRALSMLRDLGVTHLAVANNHVPDFGHAGIVATRAAIAASGIAVAGAGADLTEAAAPGIARGVALLACDAGPTPDWAVARDGGAHGPGNPGINPVRLHRSLGLPDADIARLTAIAARTGDAERRARRARIGYDAPDAAATFYGLPLHPADSPRERWQVDPADMARMTTAIEQARARADRVVVALHYHHWSPDWAGPPDWLPGMADGFLRAGADCVACTGPPVAYDARIDAGRAFAPGLGNLVFHSKRPDAYDAAGLPVWTGGALILENGRWRAETVDVLRP